VAIQQHQDIIAANYAARAAGITKHMAPAEARRLLRAVGGQVVHVHLAPGGRVSYQPYREASARMMRLLRTLPWVAVLEKASIDEAFLLLHPAAGPAGMLATAAAGGADEEALGGISPQVALQRAQEAKAAGEQSAAAAAYGSAQRCWSGPLLPATTCPLPAFTHLRPACGLPSSPVCSAAADGSDRVSGCRP
jgi:nucleotidyltransferase/DNA polymerase involved in DNA repair